MVVLGERRRIAGGGWGRDGFSVGVGGYSRVGGGYAVVFFGFFLFF